MTPVSSGSSRPRSPNAGASALVDLETVNVRYLAAVAPGDELRVEVTVDRLTERAVQVRYAAFAGDARVAEASARYVCVDTTS